MSLYDYNNGIILNLEIQKVRLHVITERIAASIVCPAACDTFLYLVPYDIS